MKKLVIILLVLTLILSVSCSKKEDKKEGKLIKIKIGATPVPHARILEVVKEELKKEGIEIQIVEFTDYVKPNTALNDGELYANFFQHKPYLDAFNKEHKMELVSIGGIHVEPYGLYSKKIKSIDELKEGDMITIPVDPSNGARSLLLLQANGLIKLKDPKNLLSTEKDIIENNKKLKFKAVDAAQLPKTLDDVVASTINTNFALQAKLDPKKAILIEGKESKYVNIVAVKKENKDSEISKKLIKVLQSDKVKEFIEKEYKGAIVPTFTK